MTKKYTLSIKTENLEAILKAKEKELPALLEKFKNTYITIKHDKMGNEIKEINPLLVGTFFFKPINPMGNVMAIYDSDQINMAYKTYSDIVEQVNMEIGQFQPTMSHFARFLGVTLTQLQDWGSEGDESMKNLIERINADIFDANMTMAQHFQLHSKTTITRLESEKQIKKDETDPKFNVNIGTLNAMPTDLKSLNDRIREITKLSEEALRNETTR